MESTQEALRNAITSVIEEIESPNFDSQKWFDDYYVESLLCSTDGELQGIEMLVSGNGPQITVNTKYSRVLGVWSSEPVIAYYNDGNGLNAAAINHYST